MGVQWTKEQQEVIRLRDRNILVSAAAGSGKTAVLVERILSKITDKEHPVDIDRLLIMTFTRAAAGEMKERISAAIEKALCEDPDNEHLQRQTTLLHTAQIQSIQLTVCIVISGSPISRIAVAQQPFLHHNNICNGELSVCVDISDHFMRIFLKLQCINTLYHA